MLKKTVARIKSAIRLVKKSKQIIAQQLFDKEAIIDLVALLVLTFSIVLIVGGLVLTTMGGNPPAEGTLAGMSSENAISFVSFIPGIPFNVGDLAKSSVATVGVASWILGIDLMLIGMGLWARHRLARLAALIVFSLALCFQVIQLLILGVLGAPSSITGLIVDAAIIYILFAKFNLPEKYS
jgi:hypothetical protein